MNLPTEIFGDVVVVHTLEQLAADQADEFVPFVTMLERSNVVVDLKDTETLDSAGLAAILDAQDAMRELGGDVKVSTDNHTNRKILEITRLDRQLDVFESVVEAVKSYS
jgi:anti-anti-sigma factor